MAGEGAPGTVLVVEDEEVVRAFLTAVLVRAGHEVIAAASSAEALEHLGRHPSVDLIVTDLTLRTIDGIELVRRARIRFPRLGGLVISGYPPDDFALERAAFLQKPFTARALAEKVSALLTLCRLD